MNEHPDIEVLLNKGWSPEVQEHVEQCMICSDILRDSELLELSLGSLQKPVTISSKREQHISQMLMFESLQIRSELFKKKWNSRVFTAAAALLIIAGVFSLSIPKLVPMAADVNKDGQINVLDSFLLAKSLENQNKLAADINGDGVTDFQDLSLLRSQIVELGSPK